MDLKALLGEAYKEGMTFEEIEAALKEVQPPEDPAGAAEISRLKTALSKANGEAAEYKKQLRGKQSEAEQEAAARQEALTKLEAENAELKRASAISAHKAKLLALGYDEKLAESTAEALADGKVDAILDAQKTLLEAQKKAVLAEKLRQTPRGPSGGTPSGEDFQKQIQDAQARGDFAAAAYYTRLAGSEIQSES